MIEIYASQNKNQLFDVFHNKGGQSLISSAASLPEACVESFSELAK
jgi:hypothetical protein